MSRFKAAIFDMDGLLIDSMLYWLDLDRQIFDKYGYELTDDHVIRLTGGSDVENMIFLKEVFNLSPEHEQGIFDLRRNNVEVIYKDKCAPMPGANELLEKLHLAGIKKAVATGAPSVYARRILDRFDWHKYFDHLAAADHVGNVGKPNPAIFLHALEKLSLTPQECVVFEDAQNGITAAKRAGMTCIAVPDKRWSFGDFSQADLVADSLNDQSIINFLNL
ncbi:MAG: hypothetical protein COU31_01480 [Candidatus Magasanikbacteria bacterium CG10_big_fil_rev_8_21_14_0_10_40_10]|uniref:HAD family phosphatase n=1 Tax=Candidatus Magasanikbacteria bacterium CG10_big_fil_rev_8_21_14_0_10_40_10 TaxID=1974648 RepID=A0A2M6W4I4_9BACT|nr:MAG: hypothetical protein COU31_01480 [Candidatus Magasanikbacteria bacterium CG10_big_fil_rev_8_21_14_0_10_40_10]